MAAPTIIKGSDHFFTTIYEGNGGGQRVGNFVPFTDNGTIAKSCIFNDGDSPYLNRTPSSASNRKTFTFSCWIKLGSGTIDSGAEKAIFSARDGSSDNYSILSINGDQSGANQIEFTNRTASGYAGYAWTTRTLEDSSKWYHIVVAVDTTDSTADDRIKLYIDGDRITTLTYSAPSQDIDMAVNNNVAHAIGARPTNNLHFDGYIAEANLVDGTALTPSTFGLTDTSTGRWIPKTLTGITYGTNGARLTFANSAGQTIGDDTSGNTNDFTVNNITTSDIVTDSPTQNFNTFGSAFSGVTLSQGNLTVNSGTSGSYIQAVGQPSFGVSSGKWYWEVKVTTVAKALYGWKDDGSQGGSQANQGGTSASGSLSTGSSGSFSAGSWFIDMDYSNEVNYTTVSTNDILMFAIDLDNGKGYCGKNGTFFNSADPANGTGSIGGCHRANGINKFYPCVNRLDTASVGEFNFGQKGFAYTPPTGFLALQQDNLPETGKGIPDLVWIKNRDATDSHQWYDSTRGPQLDMSTDTTDQESTTTDGLQKFLQGGCAIEDDVSINTVNESYVAWNWVANGGTTSANTDGSGATLASTIQANQTAGFSIVQVTAPGSPSGTYKIAHGLGAAPHWIIGKNLENSGGYNWSVYHKYMVSTPAEYFMEFNTSDAYADNATVWGDTAPTSSVFTAGVGVPLLANEKTIFYCWAPIEGYSNFGVYIGSNNANGPFIYTGFKPALVIIKSTSGHTGYPWAIYDSTRSPTNPVKLMLESNRNVVENNLDRMDFLANGFKLRQSYSYSNASVAYTYMAFAEHPFVGSGTNPVTAR